MREMDFSQKNLVSRWLGVKGMWDILQGETKQFVKQRLESFMRVEVSHRLGCSCYQRSVKRRGYRNGSYARDLLTSYGWLEGLVVPRVREGGFQPLCEVPSSSAGGRSGAVGVVFTGSRDPESASVVSELVWSRDQPPDSVEYRPRA